MLTLLPSKVLEDIIFYLNLEDVVELCSVNADLKDRLCQGVWRRDLLFPAEDRSVTDDFVKRLVRRIPRSYAVLEMRLVNLPLSWQGLLLLFDHFGHSVERIHLTASAATLAALARHLSVFAANLALLQHENKIPITFREYCVDYTNLVAAGRSLDRWLADDIVLDDPPFERLEELTIVTLDSPLSSALDHADNSSGGSGGSSSNSSNHRQIYSMADFLAGRRLSKINNRASASKRRRRLSHDNDLPPPPPKHPRSASPPATSAPPYHHPPSASAF
ncbi:hypothetical protein BX666DRAFT_2134485 [Dichotomocladium elegans]|nr:hypothetical protein BX666DRAFT_2134485 [Dichotomocladium elegans]